MAPKRIRHELFAAEILRNDEALGLNGTMLAIRKTKEDNRDWKWFENF
jgi:hypothetical protein